MARILIVEDMEDIRLAYTMILEMTGHEVKTAHSANSAKVVMQTESFDLVLTDLLMPDGDGFELASFMLGLEEAPKTILVSGGGERMSSQKAVDMAQHLFDCVLSKPLSGEQLIDAVNQTLASADE